LEVGFEIFILFQAEVISVPLFFFLLVFIFIFFHFFHDPALVVTFSLMTLKTHGEFRPFGPDTYANDQTPLCASLSAGCLLALVDHCMASTDSTDSNCNCGFAAIRPPGHHASEEKACGFCMFNNVAVAARHAQKEHGLNNIAILDWDVHHGNGTNDIFAKDKSVFFCSLHRYDDHFFPGTGFVEDVGKDQARGFNVNIPLEKGFGDLDLVHVMKHLICPLMDNFKPDAIFISAGFDAVGHLEH